MKSGLCWSELWPTAMNQHLLTAAVATDIDNLLCVKTYYPGTDIRSRTLCPYEKVQGVMVGKAPANRAIRRFLLWSITHGQVRLLRSEAYLVRFVSHRTNLVI